MSIERAVKFCNTCFSYSKGVNQMAQEYNNDLMSCLSTRSGYNAGQNIFLKTRDDATKEAMLALEESLTKGPREPTAFENKYEGSVEQVRTALDACMNCDYSRPSIVDVFIMRSQDFGGKNE